MLDRQIIEGRIETQELSLDLLGYGSLYKLYRYWDQARQGRRWLRYDSLRPEEFAFAWPRVVLVERREKPCRNRQFFIRLTGSDVENTPFGFTAGSFVEDVAVDWYRAHLIARYSRFFEAGQPCLDRVRVQLPPASRHFAYDRLLLPLTLTGDRVDLLLLASAGSDPLNLYMTSQMRDYAVDA